MKLIGFLILFFLSGNAMAYWLEKSDQTIINEADIIVYGHYQGASILKINHKGALFSLGVLKPSKILKGQKKQDVIFIKSHKPGVPISSDMLFFKVNQSGLWFLNAVPGSEGLYQITHPGQFKEMPENGSEIKQWQNRLK